MERDPTKTSPDSDAPPSSGPESGRVFGEVRVHAAMRASDLQMSDEDLAAISVHGARAASVSPERPEGDDAGAFDPMRSYSLSFHDTDPPPSSDPAPLAVGARLLAPPEVAPHEAVGRVVAGRYAIRRVIGVGGMASVLEADDARTGERVAVKIMHGDYARDPEIVARFEREARTAATASSPHIVRVIDVGRDDVVGLFLVMELLAGEDLGALLEREGRLAPLTACALAWQAAEGLARAHDVGILHRDVKPANLFLAGAAATVTVKVLDFGIAKLDDATSAGLTRVGTVLGTPQYMSPEQAQARALTPRSDVYSLGAVLFEALAGKPLVAERETLQETLLGAAVDGAPALATVLPDVDPRIAAIVDDMLFRDPSLRPEMGEVARRLAALDPAITEELPRARLRAARKAPTERRLRASGAPTAISATKSAPSRAAAKVFPLPLVAVALALALVAGAILIAVVR